MKGRGIVEKSNLRDRGGFGCQFQRDTVHRDGKTGLQSRRAAWLAQEATWQVTSQLNSGSRVSNEGMLSFCVLSPFTRSRVPAREWCHSPCRFTQSRHSVFKEYTDQSHSASCDSAECGLAEDPLSQRWFGTHPESLRTEESTVGWKVTWKESLIQRRSTR